LRGKIGEMVVGMIRAMWLFGPFNKCIFYWTDATDRGRVPQGTVEKEFLGELLSGSMRNLRRETEIEESLTQRAQFQGLALTFCIHKGFLMVIDAESDLDLQAIQTRLKRSISDAMNEEPLAFSELLSNYDLPAKIKLRTRLEGILESQHRKHLPA
jgi:hypothetical protein